MNRCSSPKYIYSLPSFSNVLLTTTIFHHSIYLHTASLSPHIIHFPPSSNTMQPLQALALLPLALAAPLLETRQTCPTPTTFQISRFLTFTPDATQNPNGNSSISFTFSDSTTGVTTTCSRTGGLSGPGDATRFYPCANPNVSFLYAGVGQPFDVEETFNCTR